MTPEETNDLLRSLARRLKLTGPLLVLDVETTGTSVENDRVVELAYVQVDPDGSVTARRTLLNPGIPIPESAAEIHGITDALVQEEKPFRSYARSLHERLSKAEAIAGFNVRRFDLPLLAAELGRCGFALDVEQLRVIDAMGIFHAREPRNLEAAVGFYAGQTHERAHSAAADVDATVLVLAKQLDRYPDLPATAAELAEASANRDPAALDLDGKVIWRDGAARLTIGDHAGKPLQDVEPGFLRWMLKKNFGASTRRIVEAALRREFPTGPRGAT